MRASTPPLYQRQPEGLAPSYHTGLPLAMPDVPTLRIPQHLSATSHAMPPTAAAQGEFVMAATAPRLGSLETSTRATNPAPFITQFPAAQAPNLHGYVSASPRTSGTGTETSASDYFRYAANLMRNTLPPPMTELAALEEEEKSLKREEEELRPQIIELERMREQLEEQTQKVAVELMQMVVLEQQYYVEPIVDYTAQIKNAEVQCVHLASRVEEAKHSLEELQRQHQSYDAVMEEKERLKKETCAVRERFTTLENRRRLCMLQSEALFDVESRRGEEAASQAEETENQLMEMRNNEPLLGIKRSRRSSRSMSRGVSFAQKSIVLDTGSDGDDDGYARSTRHTGDTVSGLTQRGSWNSAGAEDEESEQDCDRDDICGISGQSVRYSLNDTKRVQLVVPAV
ncbi:kinetoplastid kinetochore protein 8 [Trypanosoma equiperdum]|uniref:Kinetoplastid kinetochore protein 8 n=1 Tax=Trypanosoma equiperdum TaxID=5694 RepID=A0A1G4IIG4_TRYEQ|nr:kinetoplastid kinetochore protein 8 [Trypanosoma equiperdum]